MAQLFTPYQLRSLELKNRIVVSPMCQYSAVDGLANDWHLVHLGSRAVGGAGLIILEATAVSPEGRISPADLGIWKEEQVTALRRITTFIKENDTVVGVQLAHAGRKASAQAPWQGGKQLPLEQGGWDTIAPSPIPFREGDRAPQEMTDEDIQGILIDFKAAAIRALEAGFQLIELHGAHGYLFHQFLSPLSNHRTDQYGGSFENRIRLLKEVCEEVRSVWPDTLPLLVRISATDWEEGGWTPEESIELSRQLHHLGVDLIDCSSGGNVPHPKIPVGPGYQVPFAADIRQQTGIPTGAVGMITEAHQAEDIIANQQADLVFMAREMLRDPYFPLHAAKQLDAHIKWPVQYERAK